MSKEKPSIMEEPLLILNIKLNPKKKSMKEGVLTQVI
jgi:hypothetical protein